MIYEQIKKINFPLLIIFILVAFLNEGLNIIMVFIGSIYLSFLLAFSNKRNNIDSIIIFLIASGILLLIFDIFAHFLFIDKIISAIYFSRLVSDKMSNIKSFNIERLAPVIRIVSIISLVIIILNFAYILLPANNYLLSMAESATDNNPTFSTEKVDNKVSEVSDNENTYKALPSSQTSSEDIKQSTLIFSDNFSGPDLDSEWNIINKNSDSQILLGGILRLVASPLNGGSDYFNKTNFNALRLLRQIDGDWIIETKMVFLPTSTFQAAGIMLCFENNPDSNTCKQIGVRTFNPNGRSILRTFGNIVNYNNGITYFRIMKIGNSYTSWYSSDGIKWINNGNTLDNEIPEYIGVFSRQPSNDMSIYSIADFYYFNISSINQQANQIITSNQISPTETVTNSNYKNNKFNINIGQGDSGLLIVNSASLSNQNPASGESVTLTVNWKGISCPSCIVKANAFGDWNQQELAKFYNGLNGGGTETFKFTAPYTQGNYNIRLIWAYDIGTYSNYDSTNLPSSDQSYRWGDSRSCILDIPFSVTIPSSSQSSGSITLSIGESVNVGSGYMLTASSIDTKTQPRQVWLTLSKNGVKLDDKVANEGDIYTYTIKPNDKIVFEAKIAQIYAGSTSDMVIFTDISYS